MAGPQYRCIAKKSVRAECQHEHSLLLARPQLRPPQFGVLEEGQPSSEREPALGFVCILLGA